MKKLKFVLAMSALCAGMQAQPYTGLDTYKHSVTTLLSDGHLAANYPGFLLAGYQPVAVNSSNLFIDKTYTNGNFNGSIGEFKNEYIFKTGTSPCSTPIGNVANCYGVSIAENLLGGVVSYPMVAAFDNGLLYSQLDVNGVPLTTPATATEFFPFPQSVTNVSKPLIVKSALYLNQFFIAGSYMLNGTGFMYVLHVTSSGAVAWSNIYTLSGPGEVTPRAIIESPYNPFSPEIVLVGQYNDGSPLQEEGFFCRLDDATNGTVLQFDTYGSGSSSNEQFLSIAIANDPSAPGYIVGGASDVNPLAGLSWMVKMVPSGGITWSNLIKNSYNNSGKVVGVFERYSSVYSQYEYYGVSDCNRGMTVFKLDNSGNLFTQSGNTYNQFNYNDAFAHVSIPTTISFADVSSGTGTNDGIHVYGTNKNGSTWGDHFLVRACFNGAAGSSACTTTNVDLVTLPSSYVTSLPTSGTSQYLGGAVPMSTCSLFSFTNVNSTPVVTNPCDAATLPTSPWAGDQSRTAAVTGIASQSENTAQLSVSPNPVSDKLSINYTVATDSKVIITLTNQLGQVVMQPIIAIASQNENSFELNLDKMNLKDGIYFVGININGVNTTRKIVYTK